MIAYSISTNSSNVNGHLMSLQTSSIIGYLTSKYFELIKRETDAIKVHIYSGITSLQLGYVFLR